MLGWLRRRRLPLPVKMLLGASGITAGELVTGLLVNQNYGVWDYRQQPLNFLGHVCVGFSLLWIPVSMLGMWIYGVTEKRFSLTR